MDCKTKKYIIIGGICAIVLLNIVWTVLQSKFTPKLAEVQSDMAKLEQRMLKLEQGGLPDVADIREDFGNLKKISEQYSNQIEKLTKLEEDKLKSLEEQVEAQKARLESIKNLAPAQEN